MNFTYKAYRNMIYTILNNGYSISNFHNIDLLDKAVILRHDVDFSPEKALKMAQIESEIGVTSTYFVLISTNFYNVFSKEINRIFKEILNLGHEIGLHYDEKSYSYETIEDVKHMIYYEADVLGKALDIKIKTVSMHRPSKLILNKEFSLLNLENSYSRKYFTGIKYISDSRMNWREEPVSIIKSNIFNKIQILTHPFWYEKANKSASMKLKEFLEDSKKVRFNNMKMNFTNIEEYLE